jgi:hypothetical protein
MVNPMILRTAFVIALLMALGGVLSEVATQQSSIHPRGTEGSNSVLSSKESMRARCSLPASNLGHRTQGRSVCAARQTTAGNHFDGHTLGPVIAELEALTGVETRRIHVQRHSCSGTSASLAR